MASTALCGLRCTWAEKTSVSVQVRERNFSIDGRPRGKTHGGPSDGMIKVSLSSLHGSGAGSASQASFFVIRRLR